MLANLKPFGLSLSKPRFFFKLPGSLSPVGRGLPGSK
jgi:hypothetical protein